MNMFEAALFDMDGTLLNTEPIHRKAAEVLIKKLGYQDREKFEKAAKDGIGTTNYNAMELYKKAFNIPHTVEELVKEKSETYLKLLSESEIKLFDGVENLIISMKNRGIKLAVASSSPMKEIDYIIGRFGLKKYFDELITGENYKNSKPAPDIFLGAAKKLKTAPSECIVIEDSENGVKAAKKSGAFVVAYRHEDNENFPLADADIYIDDYNNAFDVIVKGFNEMEGKR